MQIESSVRANCLKRNSLNLVNWHVKRLPHCSQTSMYALNAADTPSVPTNSLVNFNEQPMKLQRLVNHTESRRNAATELSNLFLPIKFDLLQIYLLSFLTKIKLKCYKNIAAKKRLLRIKRMNLNCLLIVIVTVIVKTQIYSVFRF